MVGDDLFLLLDPIARHVDDPRRIPLVQGGADRLRRGLVGSVADQQVPEPERVLADQQGAVGPDQIAPDQAHQRAAHVGDPIAVEHGGQGAEVELLAGDGCPLDHCSLVGAQAIQTRGQQRLDRRRDGHAAQVAGGDPSIAFEHEQAVVDQHREHLLDEQRSPFGGFEDPNASLVRKRGASEQVGDQFAAVRIRESLERDRRGVELAASPHRASVQQLGSRHAQHQDRGVA